MKLERSSRRPYRMAGRAVAAAETGDRILDAAESIFWHRPTDQISLDAVAERAEVAVKTIIRHFGGKDGLFSAAAERGAGRIRRQRESFAHGDVGGAITTLVDHYDELGDGVLRLLAEEDRNRKLRAIADQGRAQHAQWCERVFATALAGRRGTERRRRLAQLIAVCDVYVWKILRHDRGLSRRDTELALVQLIQPMME